MQNRQKKTSTGYAGLILFGTTSLLAMGCGGSDTKTSTVSPRLAVPGVSNAFFLKAMTEDMAAAPSPLAMFSNPGILSAGDVGVAATADISSLQYYVTSIQFCQGLTVSGDSAYTSPTGCTTVFGSTSTGNDYTTYTVSVADADTTSTGWVDVMSKTSLDKFATNSAAMPVGDYNYVLVESRKPVKLNAQFSATNAANMRTCTGGTISANGTSGNSLLERVTVSNMTSCTRGLITMGSVGGGNWFKLASPVTVAEGKTYVLDLGFDSDQAVLGGILGSGSWGNATYHDGTRVMQVPYISFAPVLRESTAKLVREQYEISAISGVSGKLRVNLYYAGASSAVGTGTLQGVETRFLHDATSTAPSYITKPYEMTTSAGKVTLKDYAGNTIISDLTRSTTSTVGGTSTATVNKATLTVGAAFGSGTATGTVTFKGVVEL